MLGPDPVGQGAETQEHVLELRRRRQGRRTVGEGIGKPPLGQFPNAVDTPGRNEAAAAVPERRVGVEMPLHLQGLPVVRQRGDEQGADGLASTVVP